VAATKCEIRRAALFFQGWSGVRFDLREEYFSPPAPRWYSIYP
jgi:hypothetical protein